MRDLLSLSSALSRQRIEEAVHAPLAQAPGWIRIKSKSTNTPLPSPILHQQLFAQPNPSKPAGDRGDGINMHIRKGYRGEEHIGGQ